MSKNTLKILESNWPTYDLDGHKYSTIRCGGSLTVASSKSGGGMLLLCGIEVKVHDSWVAAHLSFPPDKTGLGTFTEGHMKIEGGNYLNQYFFSCDDDETWEVEKLANSPTVATKGPGKWDQLGANLWKDIDNLVTYLAYLR
ncbi:MAG TPA: hypothetical protein VL026_00575 [Rhizomicrobium sp.]|nr:hypothetical protein [Rhizomicrobium sp.]